MTATDDIELLREYARNHSEEAFATVVSRHVNLVYSVAIRRVGDPHLAEEITQVVFIILARKASSLGPGTILSAWLCRTARYAAANALTAQRRRQQREQEAHMQSISNEPGPEAWTQIAPFLDDAMARLGKVDHDAIVLRYFEGKSLRDVGERLGTNEDAAKKRVSRAVDKLRTYLARSGITLSAAVLAAAVAAQAMQAAPAGLAASATVAAVNGTTAAGSTLVLLKGTLKFMTWMKIKTAALTGAALLLATGGIIVAKTSTSQSADEPVPAAPPLPGRFVELAAEIRLFNYVLTTNEANGKITAERQYARTFPVTCMVGTNGWRIDPDFVKNGINHYFYDGTNIYESLQITDVTRMPTNRGGAAVYFGASSESSANKLTVNIHSGACPIGSMGVNIPWLAFCSGGYLKETDRVLPVPTAVASAAADYFGNVDQTRSFGDELGLPQSVDLLTSKAQYEKGLRDERMARNSTAHSLLVKPRPYPYPEGSVRFHYEVAASTNFGGWNLPVEFSYVDYDLDRQSNWAPKLAGEGRLLSIREASAPPENVFNVSKEQTVIDWRFRHPTKMVDAIIYHTTRAAVTPTNDPALQAEFVKTVDRAKPDPAMPKR